VCAADAAALEGGASLAKATQWESEFGRTYCLALSGKLLFAGGAGVVAAFDTETGKRVWDDEVPGQVRALAAGGGRLVASTERGTLTAWVQSDLSLEPARIREETAWRAAGGGPWGRSVAGIVREAGVERGYALVLGERDTSLAVSLAMQTELHVVTVAPEGADVAALRASLVELGLNGTRVVVDEAPAGARLPYASYWADMVVVTDAPREVGAAEVWRMVRPCGGVLYLSGRGEASARDFADLAGAGAPARLLVRGPLEGAGDWRAPWANSGNTGMGSDRRVRLPLELLWFGGPGPARMMSRHWGTTSPLSVAGRVFVTGQHDVLAFSAYNGTLLWMRELPGVGRKWMTWAGGNFVADDEDLYVVTGAVCHRLSQATGATLGVYAMPSLADVEPEPEERKEPERPGPSVGVDWPEAWTVYGPFDAKTPLAKGEDLAVIGRALELGGEKLPGRRLRSVRGGLDFTYLYGGFGLQPLAPGEEPAAFPRGMAVADPKMVRKTCYALAKIRCAGSGKLVIGAGADWWMAWYLDGKPIFDTLKWGNGVKPFDAGNHVFEVDVRAGEHVVAVAVRSGSAGWSLVSAAGPQLERRLAVSKREPPKRASWGYLALGDGLVVGSMASRWLSPGESSQVFALEEDTGRMRWRYGAEVSVPNRGVALGEGKVFVLDTTPESRVWRARNRNETIETVQKLVALELSTGRGLWTQEDVPAECYRVQYSAGKVVVGGRAVYDAESGRKLWSKDLKFRSAPLVTDGWIIAQPQAWNLSTGEPRREPDPVTGRERDWRWVRTYGCGAPAGCGELVFFRSGAAGFLDMAGGGTTNFGGMRPGCSVNVIAAGGLVVIPEASSGCTCSYNFQSSLALVPGEPERETWYVLGGERPEEPVRHLRLNLGAPGDRRDGKRRAWLGWPRPKAPGAYPVEMTAELAGATWPYSRSATAAVKDVARPWLYSSALEGSGRLVVSLAPQPPAVAPMVKAAPKLDGELDDACWKAAPVTPWQYGGHVEAPEASLRMAQDSENIYVAYRREASVRRGKRVPLVGKASGEDAKLNPDDALLLALTDAAGETVMDLGVSCSGARYDALDTPKTRAGDAAWDGAWRSAAKRDETGWSVEIAVPRATLKAAGLDAETWRVNAASVNRSGVGRDEMYLTNPGERGMRPCRTFLDVVRERKGEPAGPVTVRVRMHLAEEAGVRAGERVFDVLVAGKPALTGLDAAREAGGAWAPVVKEAEAVVPAGAPLVVELRAAEGSKRPPRACALEVERVE
jgi:outer membrane protein assembly factor BamB